MANTYKSNYIKKIEMQSQTQKAPENNSGANAMSVGQDEQYKSNYIKRLAAGKTASTTDAPAAVALGFPKVNASRPDAKKELQEPTLQPQGDATNDVTKLQADLDAAKQAEADAWDAYNRYNNSTHWSQIDRSKLDALNAAAVAAQENRKKAETMLQTAKYGSEYAEKYGADTKLGANMMGIDKGVISIGKSIAATPGVLAQTSKAAYEEGSAESEDPEVLAAREKEAAAKRAADNFVAMNIGSMDMPEKQAELAKLNEALAAATAERKAAESKHDVALDMSTKSMQDIKTAGALRDDATSDLSGFEKDLADAVLSVGQNLPFMPVAAIPVVGQGLALAGMSGVAAAQSMYDQGTQGKSAGDAFQHGVASGAIEALTEKIPLDNLADMVKTGGKSFVVNLLKQVGVEAAEEGVSYAMNYILDEAEDNPDAKFDWGEFWQSVKVGGLSGLFFGAGGTIVGNIRNGQSSTPSGTTQQPTTQVNLPDTGANDAGAGVDTAEGNVLSGGENGQKNAASTGETVRYTPVEITQIRREGETFRNLVAGVDATVSEFFRKWRNGRKSHLGEKLEKLYLAKMPDSVKRRVSDLLGYEVSDRDFIVTNDEVKHIMDHHGSAEQEIQKGNLPLDGWVFDSIQDVLTQPDTISKGHAGTGTSSNKTGVIFEKTMPNGRVVCVQFDNPGRGTMSLKTLYVKESTSPAVNTPGGANTFTSKTTEPVLSSNITVSQAEQGVNGQSAQTGAELSAEITAKGQKYLDRAESKLINELEQALYIPPQRQGSLLKDSVREISLEYLNTGLISEEKLNSLAARAHELGLEVDKTKVNDVVRAKVGEAQGELEVIRRYVQDQMNTRRDQAALTMEDVKALYPKVKDARKKAEKAVAKNLLTQDDEMRVNELLRGQISIESLDPTKNNVQGITEVYQAKSEYEQLAKQIRQWNKARKAALKEKADAYLQTANTWRDKLGLAYKIETMERNFRGLVPDRGLAEDIIAEYITPVHKAQAESTRTKNEYRERVRNLNLSRKVDKSKGNIVSEAHAVQLLGEAEDNIRILQRGHTQTRDGKSLEDWQGIVANLWNENPGLDEAKIRNAVQEFREIYDELFDQMNDARMRNGYEPVNYRSGYFPHFQPGDGDSILAQFGKALGIDTAVTALPTSINGMTHTFKPGIQWFGNAQERLGFNTAYDAVEGFDKYIEGVSDVIHQTDNIQNLRALAAQMRYRTTDEGIRKQVDEVEAMEGISEEDKKNRIDKIYEKAKFALNHFVVELEEYTNLLANKKSMADRNMEQALGRKAYSAIKAIESRVAANMVAINPASWLTNFVPLTQGWATVNSGAMLKGAWDTLKAYKTSDGIVDKSTFLTNRRGSDPLVRTWTQNTSAVLSKPMEYIDHFTADTLVRARYYQNLKEGLSEAAAMDDADSWVAGVMADRSKGSMPTIFNQSNPVTKLFTQFQLEVNNQFGYLFKDLPREMKDKGLAAMAGALFKFFLGAFLFNELYEYFIGRRPALDPIGILNDTAGDLTGYELPNLVELGVGAMTGDVPSFQTDKKGTYEALKNTATGLAEEMPFAGGLLGGGRVPISSALPDLSKLGQALVDGDWSTKKRATTGLNELIKPLMYVAPPFGGGQLKKVAQGTEAIIRKGSYSVDADGNDLLQYPVYRDTPAELAESVLTSALFGKSSLKTAQDWVESGFDSLGAKETAVYKAMTEDGISGRDAFAILKEMRGANGKTEKLDIVAQSGMPEKTVKDLAGLIMGTEMKTESGNPTQYAKLVQAMDTALSAQEAIEMQIAGIDMGEFLEMTGAGVDAKTARDLMMALAEAKIDWLPIGENKLRQYRAVTDSNMSDDDQMEAMGVLMGEAEYSKLQTGYDYGVTPKIYVKYKEAVYSRGDVNTQAEIKAVIDAMNIEDVQVKATLWQMANKGWSPKNNPYSATVGAAVKDALG